MKKCFVCNQPETCFKKKYKRNTWKKEIVVVMAAGDFWLCTNENCILCVHIDTQNEHSDIWHKLESQWTIARITELNKEAFEAYKNHI